MMMVSRPLIMGASMGLMMLWMLHGLVTGNSAMSGPAIATFVGIHIILAVLILGGGLFAARLSPAARIWLSRLHRPSLRHVAQMITGAILSAGTVHIWFHGLI